MKDPKDESSGNSEYEGTVREFRNFLSDCKDVLDEATTVKLLGRYNSSLSRLCSCLWKRN